MNPRQIQMLTMDVYGLLAEILGEVGSVIVDGGANVGATTELLAQRFPGAQIHAFEPVGELHEALEPRCRSLGAVAHRVALGERATSTEIHVNRNLWTCSLLAANARALDFHGDWCETLRSETVRVIRLDDWAEEHGVGEVALIKLDLQGYELPALRGAERTLQRTLAVYSEAQISPEYSGAATFSEIDLYLREMGFSLYQMADLCLKGAHCEPSCCDALWLRSELLEEVRSRAAPEAIRRSYDRRALLMSAALDECAKRRAGEVMVYGAGAHTRACGASLADAPVGVVGLIDDRLAGSNLWGWPIVSLDDAVASRPSAVVLSSDVAEDALRRRSAALLEAGVPVVSLYDGPHPRWLAPGE